MQFGLKEFRLRDQSIKCCAFFVFNLAYHHVDHPKRPFVHWLTSPSAWSGPAAFGLSQGVRPRRILLGSRKDAHDLHMSPHVRKCWQDKCDTKPLDRWVPQSSILKRQREDADGQDLRPSKRSARSVTPDGKLERSLTLSLNPPDLITLPTSISSKPSEVSFLDSRFDDDLLPELSLNLSTSPSDSDEPSSLAGIQPNGNLSTTSLMEGLGSKGVNGEVSDDDALFAQYLRSPSPAYTCAEDDRGQISNQNSIPSPNIAPRDICLTTRREPRQAGLLDDGVSKSKTNQVQAKKLRTTLRVHHPKPAPKPQVYLRLSKPKKAPLRGPKCRRRKRT